MLTVYSKNNCPFCTQAKSLLTAKSIAFQEIKIDEDAAAKEGGFTGLSKLTESQLKEKLNAVI